MRAFSTFLFAILCFSSIAQTTSTFEDFDLAQGTFLNDGGIDGGFQNGNIFFPNTFDANYNFWTGWAISATTDTTTPGFENQFSSITGGGFDGSDSYAVGYSFSPSIFRLTDAAQGGGVEGMYITNGTYAYLSLSEGDGIAKKFGGETGDDPDYFVLTIRKYLDGNLSTDSINFYLADYRFEDNSQDYIINEWTYVDLSALGNADSLEFRLSSTDTGMFGMNTPAYFCVDNITTSDMVVNVEEAIIAEQIQVFPNPASSTLTIQLNNFESVLGGSIFDLTGRRVQSISQNELLNNQINIQSLPSGAYWLMISEENRLYKAQFVKS